MSPLSQMLQLLVLTTCALGAVYFIFYRPTVSAQNRQRRVIAGLRKGDEVVTISGFIATVVDVREPDDGPVELLLDLGGVTVRARTNAIADRLPRPEEDEAETPRHQGHQETVEKEPVAT
jgi:preprotein translocase YajC subunit